MISTTLFGVAGWIGRPHCRKRPPDLPSEHAQLPPVALLPNYVMEGSVEFGIDGGEPFLLEAGGSYFEPPGVEHSISRNASETLPASLLAFFVLADGESPIVQDHD